MIRRISFLAVALVSAAAACQVATAGIADDLANAVILEEFLFDDPNGTVLTALANNVTSNQWTEDSDTTDVATTGTGLLNASLKNNDGFGTNYVNNSDIYANLGQRVFGVMELTWDFDPNSLDTVENEEIRISLMQNDPTSTFVVAEFEIQREDDNTVTILGNGVGTGSDDIDAVVLNGGSLSQSSKFIAVIDANMAADTFDLHFSNDGGANFTSLTGGLLDPTRDSIRGFRMVLNNNLSQDSVLIDRVYLAKIPEPTSGLLMMLGFCGIVARRSKK